MPSRSYPGRPRRVGWSAVRSAMVDSLAARTAAAAARRSRAAAAGASGTAQVADALELALGAGQRARLLDAYGDARAHELLDAVREHRPGGLARLARQVRVPLDADRESVQVGG